MPVDLFRVEEGFADDRVEYLSGLGHPDQDPRASKAPIGSNYSDINAGEKWFRTKVGWKKVKLEP